MKTFLGEGVEPLKLQTTPFIGAWLYEYRLAISKYQMYLPI